MTIKRRSTTPETSPPPPPQSATAGDSTVSPFHHNDLIRDILSRLPIKSIKRFESVSKLWYSLINSDDFITAHLRRSTSRRPTLLIPRFHSPTSTNYAICLFDYRTSIPREVMVPVPFLASLVRLPKIVGSCNGLLCLDISPCYATSFVLWNIATKRFRLLPKPKINGSGKRIWMVATGFGHNRETNDYNVVRIVNFQCELDESRIVRAEIFSWITGSWRLIDGRMTEEELSSCVIHEGQRAVLVNDSFCWIANRFGSDFDNRKWIVFFDLATEEFRKIPLPEFTRELCCKVIKFKESLGFAAYAGQGTGKRMDVIEWWVLEEEKCDPNGGKNNGNWSQLYSVDLNFPLGIPVGVHNDTELLIKRVDSRYVALSVCDPYNNRNSKNIPVCGSEFSCEFYSYVESLVPVTSAGDDGLMEEETGGAKD